MPRSALSRNPVYSEAIKLFRQCRCNGRHRNVGFDITREDIYQLLLAQQMRCAVTGLDFDTGPRTGSGRCRPFAPSIDRIDAQQGYIPGNVRAVCVAVNAALGDWGDAVLQQIAVAICAKSRLTFTGNKADGVHVRQGQHAPRYEINIRHGGKHHYFGSTRHLPDANAKAAKIKARLMAGEPAESIRATVI